MPAHHTHNPRHLQAQQLPLVYLSVQIVLGQSRGRHKVFSLFFLSLATEGHSLLVRYVQANSPGLAWHPGDCQHHSNDSLARGPRLHDPAVGNRSEARNHGTISL